MLDGFGMNYGCRVVGYEIKSIFEENEKPIGLHFNNI